MTNIVIIAGKLARDPEPIANGKGARLSVGVSEKYKDKNEQWQEKTTWVNVTLWTSVQYALRASKGSSVLIHGKLDENKYTNKDGVEVKTMQVVVNAGGSIAIYSGLKDKDAQIAPKESYNQTDDFGDTSIPF